MLTSSLLLVALSANSYATPTIAGCGSSSTPSFPWDYKCDMDGVQPCTWDAGLGEVVCSLATVGCDSTDTSLYAVKTAGAVISSFGSCKISSVTHNFCCTVTDSLGEVDVFSLDGSSSREEPIAFKYQDGAILRQMGATHGNGFVARIRAGAGNDLVYGSDTTSGGSYIERLYGNQGDDDMFGEGSNDEMWGGLGHDYMVGGTGNDIMFGENGDDYMYGGNGNDKVHAGNGDDWLYGDADEDVLYGGRGEDHLFGGGCDDVLCDTTLSSGTCTTYNYLQGGTDGDEVDGDRASMYEHASCPASGMTLDGDDSVEEAQDTSFYWDDVLTATGTVVGGANPSPYYSECVDITTLGGL